MLKILDSIDAHIYILNVDTYKILYMNQKMQDTFGHNLQGQTCWRSLYQAAKPCAHCAIGQLSGSDDSQVQMVEKEVYNPITKRWYLQCDRMIRWIDQQPVKLQIATDITRIKQLEAERRDDEQLVFLAKKQEALSRMAGAIAHHFNNQLMIVLGYLDLAMEETDNNVELENLLQAASTAAKKTSAIGGTLLCYLGQNVGDHKLLDLSEICRQHLPTIRKLLPAAIVLNIVLTPHLIINSDTSLVQQILTHLITNSYESLEDASGTITLTVTPVAVSSITAEKLIPTDWQPTAEHYCCIRVTDTGWA